MKNNSFILLLVLTNCITIQTTTIPQKTALENQLMGKLSPLSEDELLIASVRSTHAQSSGIAQSKVLAARRRQLFNRDDIDELKSHQCLGETYMAKLVRYPCTIRPYSHSRIDKLITQENSDRSTLMSWFISKAPNLTSAERIQGRKLYYKLIIASTPTNTPFETEGGKWVIKGSTDAQ